MRSIALLIGLLASCGPVLAGGSAPAPSPAASYTDAQAAAAAAPLIASSIAAAMPANCGAAPAADTLNGTIGSGTPCVARPDATRPTAVQAATATTDTNGNIAVTFVRPTVSSSPIILLIPQNSSGSLPVVCNWITRSTTGFTAGCWQSQSTTLGGTLTALINTVITPFKAGAPGVAVSWIAREPTQ